MAQDHIWAPLAEGQPTHHREPGQMIYLQDTEAAQFYYILTGTVKCFISSPDGDERTLALHHGGELIGEASFFDRQPRVSSAVAVTPCELISVNRQHLEAVFARRPDLAISMLEYLARTVRLLSGHVDSAFLQADKRIARHLLALEPDARGLLHCTHEEIGSSVGVSRVTVSRVLGDFDRRGWVETGYKSLKLCNRQAIADFLTEGVSVGWYFLLAAAGLDLLLPFLLAPFYPGYSHRRQVMSVLGSPESPVRWVYRVWLVALGLLLCAATPDLWAAFGNRSPVLTGLLIAVLCVFALGAGVLAGLFSVNADKAVETAASRIHGVGSVLGFLALAFAPLLVALLAFRDGAGGAGVFSLICFALDVCCFTLFVMADKEAWRGTRLAQEGTWQRLTLLFMYLPLAVLAASQLIQK